MAPALSPAAATLAGFVGPRRQYLELLPEGVDPCAILHGRRFEDPDRTLERGTNSSSNLRADATSARGV